MHLDTAPFCSNRRRDSNPVAPGCRPSRRRFIPSLRADSGPAQAKATSGSAPGGKRLYRSILRPANKGFGI